MEAPPANPVMSACRAVVRRGALGWCALALVVVTVATYWSALPAPFVADDQTAIVTNPTIRQLWPLGPVLQPPEGTTVSGRPLLNLSFALNHAISGEAAWSYHALNLAIHVLAGVTLFGLVRRTLRQPVLGTRFGEAATGIAFLAAGLWLLHPLHTSAVTYVTQRAESLAGLCYLVAMYGFVRATEQSADRNHGWDARATWLLLSAVACFAGMATKEILVSAPVVVLLYDRTFVAGSFRAAWRQRRSYYVVLAASWLLLAGLMRGLPGHGEGVGFTPDLWAGDYLVTQAYALVLYLKLTFWPAPLVFDYGPGLVVSLTDGWMQALVVVGLLAASTEAVLRRAPIGFASAWFFGILAPTSSFVPIAAQTIAEHRMYLPLAAVIVAAVVAGYRLAGRASLIGGVVIAVALGWATHQRNAVFQSDHALWTDTLEHWPSNVRALHALAVAHSERAEHQRAVSLFEEALRLDPQLRYVAPPAVVHATVGQHLVALGRLSDAIRHYQQALERDPYQGRAHYGLAVALMQQKRPAIALRHFREAVRLNYGGADAVIGLAEAYLAREQIDEAMENYREALRLDPQRASVHENLGDVLAAVGRSAEAIDRYATAVQLDPENGPVRRKLGEALRRAGRSAEAAEQLAIADRLEPVK